MRILMVEDNPSVTEMMGMFFKKENWDVTYANDGEVAIDTFTNADQPFDMILLDLNLPKKDGMQVSAEIRKMSPTVPIVMLTARSSESDQVLGLEMGADDYVTKPFSPITLIARLKALYRRTQLAQPEVEPVADGSYDVQTDNFKLNTKTREAYLNGQLIHDLTPKEFDLLRVMAMKPKQVFTREQLLEQVWNYEYMGDERTVDAHIKKLRQKIRAVGPQIIQTVWGVGYKFDDSDAK